MSEDEARRLVDYALSDQFRDAILGLVGTQVLIAALAGIVAGVTAGALALGDAARYARRRVTRLGAKGRPSRRF